MSGRHWRIFAAGAALLAAACVQQPTTTMPGPSGDVIELRMGYLEAFDRVVRALERAGYTVEAADERVGLIRTAPTPHEGAGGISYRTAVIVRMGGTSRESWLAVDIAAAPTFPEEERKVRELIEEVDR